MKLKKSSSLKDLDKIKQFFKKLGTFNEFVSYLPSRHDVPTYSCMHACMHVNLFLYEGHRLFWALVTICLEFNV